MTELCLVIFWNLQNKMQVQSWKIISTYLHKIDFFNQMWPKIQKSFILDNKWTRIKKKVEFSENPISPALGALSAF
jgi:hypothetical protein